MGIKALDLTPQDFVSKYDEVDPEVPNSKVTTWKIRGLTRLEWMEVENGMQTSAITLDGETIKQIANQTNTGSVGKTMLDYGLVGWEDFYDNDGKAISFSVGNMERIPREIRDEISGAIARLTSINQETAKN